MAERPGAPRTILDAEDGNGEAVEPLDVKNLNDPP